MLEVQVTGKNGRYGFLTAGSDDAYYITANKDGYQEFKSKLMKITTKRKEQILGEDIYLKQLNK